jgi:BirA family transcriptional regulator, biotin operon repressor / biotin---[acetyl-CoA-carboxylase] ligase
LSSRFGKPHHHFEEIDSTNERAREMAIEGAEGGTVVTASSQTAGRGRHGRRWVAPPDEALLYSAILRPLTMRHLMLPLAVPIAVCEACEELAKVECLIKWPNDIWLEEKKLAGVLIEARPPEWAVIGVGVNVSIADDEFPEDLRWPATSLGGDATPQKLRTRLDKALGRWVEADAEKVRSEFERRDALNGRPISWEGGPEGVGGLDRRGFADGIDERGNLIVRGEHGEEIALGSGEVHLRLL